MLYVVLVDDQFSRCLLLRSPAVSAIMTMASTRLRTGGRPFMLVVGVTTLYTTTTTSVFFLLLSLLLPFQQHAVVVVALSPIDSGTGGPSTRRQVLAKGSSAAACSAMASLLVLLEGGHYVPAAAVAATTLPRRGAAELDLEYYARAVWNGNRPEGSTVPSTPPPRAPPRKLSERLVSLLLGTSTITGNGDDSSSSAVQGLPVQALLRELGGGTSGRGGNAASADAAVFSDLTRRVNDYRSRAERSFYVRAPWFIADGTDQYYFDVMSYALWRAIADVLPELERREHFVRRLGRDLYTALRKDGHLHLPPPRTLSESGPALDELLAFFQRSAFLRSYRIEGDPETTVVASSSSTTATTTTQLFDTFDDDALRAGATVDCLIGTIDPATLGASLQIVGEGSRFTPDGMLGATLAALWEESGTIRVASWETYFVDNVYRPNPKDYFPDEQLLQFSLTRATA